MLKTKVQDVDCHSYVVFNVGATAFNALTASWVLVDQKESGPGNAQTVF